MESFNQRELTKLVDSLLFAERQHNANIFYKIIKHLWKHFEWNMEQALLIKLKMKTKSI